MNMKYGCEVPILKSLSFNPLGDERGSLVALEGGIDVPFDIKRVYYIFGTVPGVARGFHAHMELEQVAVCVTGSCRMVLDSGFGREEIILNSSTKGIHIPTRTWREMHDFSPDCVLLVLASQHYDEGDYIRDYSQFLDELNNHEI
jgi:dTDP-4-dehydrorhamnose 3,5-epimerase-like enzyme